MRLTSQQTAFSIENCATGSWIRLISPFHDPIPRGEYNLVVSTRCGDGRDYALRRIGHPVTVP